MQLPAWPANHSSPPTASLSAVEKFISISKLKYYFAVDNGYVAKKLSILIFPFFHRSWDIKYDSAGPVPPRADLNSPDLYIPVMAFLTYVLVAGLALGIDGRFSPESLSIFSSQALGWLVLEVCILTLALYLLNIQSNLGYLDIFAYSGYKFVHMITVIFAFLALAKPGYYFSLIWTGLAFAFFQIRSLRLQVLSQAEQQPYLNPRRGTYVLVCAALFQPLVIWWLTSSVVSS
ncbi:Protein yif1b [Sparganum proliferum]